MVKHNDTCWDVFKPSIQNSSSCLKEGYEDSQDDANSSFVIKFTMVLFKMLFILTDNEDSSKANQYAYKLQRQDPFSI